MRKAGEEVTYFFKLPKELATSEASTGKPWKITVSHLTDGKYMY